MKKNIMMRAASALLVAVLLTTSAISGTFAKYVTSTTGTAEARVAYWGFKQGATLEFTLFANAYTGTDGENTVIGEDGANVVAPGTSRTHIFAFAFTQNANKSIAAPEVSYKITIDAIASGNYTALDNNPNFKWTLKAADDTGNATQYDKVADLLAAIKKLSGATDDTGTGTYDAGTLPTKLNGNCEIGWVWEFEDTDESTKATQDATDTAMGNAETLDNVEITITITATQID